MIELVRDLFNYPRTITDLDGALAYISKIIPLTIHEWKDETVFTWPIKDAIKVGEHEILGSSKETIIIPIHLDHPKQANDNLSGVAVAIELAKSIKNPRYTYKFLFLPETIGTHAYLHRFGTDFKYGIVIDAVGGDGDLVTTTTKTPSILNLYISGKTNEFLSDAHLWSGNDERALEAFNIPSIQISRSPFLEYHTERDTPDRISEQQLQNTLVYVRSIIDKIERDFVPLMQYKGVPCLSANGLWRKEYGSPHTFMKVERIWQLLTLNLHISEISHLSGNTFDFTYDFVMSLKSKDLVC